MAGAGKVQLDSAGREVLTASGKQAIGDDCCCNVGAPCTACPDDPTPKRIKVTLAGVLCPGCFAQAKWTANPDPMPVGEFILTQTGNPCIWYWEQPASGTLSFYSDACVTKVDEIHVVAFFLRVVASGPYVMIDAGCITDRGGCGMSTETITLPVFSWWVDKGTGDCFPRDTTIEGTNALQACGWSGSPCTFVAGKDGSATVEVP